MAESHTIMKIVVGLGILVLLITTLTTPTYVDEPIPQDSSWNTFSNSLTNGPDFPEFDNPFTRYSSKGTALPDNPTNGGSPTLITFVGCNNETTDSMRPDCVNTQDGDESYVEFVNDTGFFEFNWTRKDFFSFTGAEIRKVILTVQCRTTNGTDAFNFGLVWGNNTGGPFQSCPRSEKYTDVLYEFNTPTGYGNNPFEFTPSDPRQAYLSSGGLGRVATGRFTFIRIEVFVTDEVVCTATNWFNDQACQIGRFVDTVIKGFLYFFNAVSYVLSSIGVALVWIGTVVVNLFIGLIGLFGAFFSVSGAPPLVQAIITMFFVGMVSFVIIFIVLILRGSGTVA
ncbi:MAG TPA: hypothetical protein VJ044_17605 [Candidatus Hodarchaeales archaeon]|nr:hypothetical protein [Candidatus Hodarchaeales archaeon]